jgi:hypothetical protein
MPNGSTWVFSFFSNHLNLKFPLSFNFCFTSNLSILIGYGPTTPLEQSNHWKVDPQLFVKLVVAQLQLQLGFLILQQQQTLT